VTLLREKRAETRSTTQNGPVAARTNFSFSFEFSRRLAALLRQGAATHGVLLRAREPQS